MVKIFFVSFSKQQNYFKGGLRLIRIRFELDSIFQSVLVFRCGFFYAAVVRAVVFFNCEQIAGMRSQRVMGAILREF